MNDPLVEARRWLSQATNDLEFARVGLREGFYAQTCFQSQQAAEKAVKALHYLRGKRVVLGHSVWELLKEVLEAYPEAAAHADTAKLLDLYYIPPRYPNGIPAGVPFEVFTRMQAAEAVASAERLIAEIANSIAKAEAESRKLDATEDISK